MQSSQGDPAAGFAVIAVFVVVGIVSLILYVVPTVIAIKRNHPQIGPIIVINLVFGWSLIGWVVAFAWSVSHINRPMQIPRQPQQAVPPPDYNYKRI